MVSISAQAAAPRVLIMGDSISAAFGLPLQAGWVALLEDKLAAEGVAATVINASVSGETTQGGLRRLAPLLSVHQPQLVIIELGGNDGLRGLPILHIKQNLQQMIQQAQQAGSQVILLGMQIPPNYGAKYTNLFAQNYAQLAKQYNLAWVPFFLAEVAEHKDLMQADGIHPTAAAQPILLQHAWPLIRSVLTPAL